MKKLQDEYSERRDFFANLLKINLDVELCRKLSDGQKKRVQNYEEDLIKPFLVLLDEMEQQNLIS